ncbi:PREDICTED: uncharacterized protein LOC109235382 [Nicotiana attenuata]|uniref:uncharacterized protein LOC109235382 n=1 Tax=Nicotiana attenuata TaxID=49451 RepID=UPI000904F335|nr:PREDICTED: uncharacterized protein LOC109235382 [Nicotiana attenuata]
MCTVTCLIAFAVKHNWSLFQLDVNNAFLHRDLDEEASRKWYAKLSQALCSRGYTHSLNDYSHFIRKTTLSVVSLVVYVDDIILTGDDLDEIIVLKSFLDAEFKIKDLGLLNYFLLFFSLDLSTKLKSDVGNLLPRPDSYRSLIGKLNFLNHTRSDLCFAVQHLSPFLKTPRAPHMAAALHVLRYLKGTAHAGGFLNNTPDLSLFGYCDSNWASCPDSRR